MRLDFYHIDGREGQQAPLSFFEGMRVGPRVMFCVSSSTRCANQAARQVYTVSGKEAEGSKQGLEQNKGVEQLVPANTGELLR